MTVQNSERMDVTRLSAVSSAAPAVSRPAASADTPLPVDGLAGSVLPSEPKGPARVDATPDPALAALRSQKATAGVNFGRSIDTLPEPYRQVSTALWQNIQASTLAAGKRGETPMEPTFLFSGEVRKLALASYTAEDQARTAESRGETPNRAALLAQELINQVEASILAQHATTEQLQMAGARANAEAETLAASGQGGSAAGLLNTALKSLFSQEQLQAMIPEVHQQPLAQVLVQNQGTPQFLAPSLANGFESLVGTIRAASDYHRTFLAVMEAESR